VLFLQKDRKCDRDPIVSSPRMIIECSDDRLTYAIPKAEMTEAQRHLGRGVMTCAQIETSEARQDPYCSPCFVVLKRTCVLFEIGADVGSCLEMMYKHLQKG
jgi:hypothetical protein